ncbi:hypothetical protein MMC08_008927 [Hypocenomyce scalaris]|nr:hypothetical protein [Hypocenomyce scalaris]
MQLFIPSLITALSSLRALTLAVLLTQRSDQSSTLNPRSDFCYNAPNTKAGTHLSRRSPLPPNTPLHPRATPTPPVIIWCAPGTSTYVRITFEYYLDDEYVATILLNASTAVGAQISAFGDGTLTDGAYSLQDYGLELSFRNAANHQLTWGVARAAVQALQGYMGEYMVATWTVWAAVTFLVFDGVHQVGTGVLQVT